LRGSAGKKVKSPGPILLSSSDGLGDDVWDKKCRCETLSTSSSDCLVAKAKDCVAPTGWTTLGNFMSVSTIALGTDTYGFVVVGKTVEAFDVVATGTLRTGEPSGTLGVVVETITIAKGKGGGCIAN
jgi:hypothetical protein